MGVNIGNVMREREEKKKRERERERERESSHDSASNVLSYINTSSTLKTEATRMTVQTT